MGAALLGQNPKTNSPAKPPTGAQPAPNSATNTRATGGRQATAPRGDAEQRTDLWFGVLLRLADGFPASKFAQVDSEELREMASTWADDLGDVPAIAIPELHRRTMTKHTSTFAPSIGDYRATWLDPAWDFWADLNADEEKHAPALPMLPEAPRDTDGPGTTAAALQIARLRGGKAMVCCECYTINGNAKPATLSPDKNSWICAESQCGFTLDFWDTDETPIQPRREVERPVRHTTNDDEQEKAATAKGRASLADIRRVADECDLDLDAMDAREHADFCAWVNWFRRSSPGAIVNYTVLQLTWPKCQAEMQERLNQRLQI